MHVTTCHMWVCINVLYVLIFIYRLSIRSFFFFFFKQKTAYEIYQCDWSSDVCSSDLQVIKALDLLRHHPDDIRVAVPEDRTHLAGGEIQNRPASNVINICTPGAAYLDVGEWWPIAHQAFGGSFKNRRFWGFIHGNVL